MLSLIPVLVSPLLLSIVAASSHQGVDLLKRSELSQDGVADIRAINDHLNYLEEKYLNNFAAYEKNTGRQHPLVPTGLSRRPVASEPLKHAQKSHWYGLIQVGTPPQTFTVDIDTGTSDFIVPSSSCSTGCEGHKAYDPAKSSTSHELNTSFNLTYGNGAPLSGEVYCARSLVRRVATSSTPLVLGRSPLSTSRFFKHMFILILLAYHIAEKTARIHTVLCLQLGAVTSSSVTTSSPVGRESRVEFENTFQIWQGHMARFFARRASICCFTCFYWHNFV